MSTFSVSLVLELNLSAASTLNPGLAPLFEVNLNTEPVSSIANFANELFKHRILKLILAKVGLKTLFKDLSATEEDYLMQKGGTLSITDTIKDVLGSPCVNDIRCNGVTSVLLILV